MGNSNSSKDINISNDEVKKYSRPGISINDLKNLKKAFMLLDKDQMGVITYDVNKIGDIEKYKHIIKEDEETIVLNMDQFMEIMVSNIIDSRKKFGREKIQFESETSNVTCILCPFRNKDEFGEKELKQ